MNLDEHERNYEATLAKLVEQKRVKRNEQLRKYYSPESIPHPKYQGTKWRDLEQEWQNNPSNPAFP